MAARKQRTHAKWARELAVKEDRERKQESRVEVAVHRAPVRDPAADSRLEADDQTATLAHEDAS